MQISVNLCHPLLMPDLLSSRNLKQNIIKSPTHYGDLIIRRINAKEAFQAWVIRQRSVIYKPTYSFQARCRNLDSNLRRRSRDRKDHNLVLGTARTLLRLSVEANHRIDGTSMHISSVELSVVWSEGDDPDAGHVAQLQDISTIAARALNKCITTQTGV